MNENFDKTKTDIILNYLKAMTAANRTSLNVSV